MTHEELEEYIIKYLPGIRKQFVITDDDEDWCQQALINISDKLDTLNIKDIHDFNRTFFSYYNQRRIHGRIDEYRRLLPFLDTNIDNSPEYSHNPWENNVTEALEYIELIKGPWLRSIMFDYYINGLTQPEIGTKHSITQQYVQQLLQRGIKQIKQSMSSSPDPLKG